jgi:hypothetical protein
VSLTESEEVHAGLHGSGVNDLFTAVFTARPRLSTTGASPLVAGPPAAPAAWIDVAPIAFPGIDWGVQFEIPVVDFHPDSIGRLPPALTLAVGRLSLKTAVTLMCSSRRGQCDMTDPMRDALKGIALRFGLVPAASLLPVIVWVAGLIGVVCAALRATQAALRLLIIVSLVGGIGLPAVAVVDALVS